MKNRSKSIFGEQNSNFTTKMFVVIAIIFGLTFSFFVPFYQIPDEPSHYEMIYNELGIQDSFSKQVKKYNDFSRIIINYDEKVNVNKYLNFNYKFYLTNIKFNLNVNIIKHFPQAIGILFANVLSLPITIGTLFAEICAMAFYIFVCYKALKKMPIKKELMMFIMLLPMSIQQMSSVSYDAVLLPFCFLFISEIFYLKFEKKEINTKDIMKLLIILIIIAIIKMPYVLLGMLILLLPLNKLKLNFKLFVIDYEFLKKHKKQIIICSIILLAIILGFLIFNIKSILKLEIVRQFVSFAKVPLASSKLFARTFYSQGLFYLSSFIGNFGWLDTPIPIWLEIFIIIIFLAIAFVNLKGSNKIDINYKFKIWEKILLLFICITITILIMIPMFYWSLSFNQAIKYLNSGIEENIYYIKRIDYIIGVQGRYFLPYIILLFLPFNNSKVSNLLKKCNMKKGLYIYYAFIYVCLIIILLNRYWIG